MDYSSGAEIPGARSPRLLHFVWWSRTKAVNHRYSHYYKDIKVLIENVTDHFKTNRAGLKQHLLIFDLRGEELEE
jgi:hypothetical protein